MIDVTTLPHLVRLRNQKPHSQYLLLLDHKLISRFLSRFAPFLSSILREFPARYNTSLHCVRAYLLVFL
jgi:hypothetical protein